ncbi:hypothetical protein PCC8801_3573 [Rippkaea orientalis PCC 8801]|uniref:PEP-CTERM protein-sorting domain-containing protein n=2 Tax=Rippkaea TaxID=2546365 RepID=B7K1J4_RIPO1|nr:hypothetical protein PCC8801_3573 [Rippkaea orientalis PCC 8801]
MGQEQVQAASLQNTVGIATPILTINLNELSPPPPNFTSITNQFSTVNGQAGVIFSNTVIPAPSNGLFYITSLASFPNIGQEAVSNLNGFTSFSIKFVETQTEAAFSMVTDLTTATFTAKKGGTVVESFSTTTNLTQTNNFFGFTDVQTGFDEILIELNRINNNAIPSARIGAIQLGGGQPEPEEIPEPTFVFGLLAIALLGTKLPRKPLSTSEVKSYPLK